MNTSNNTPNKILIPLLALGLITVGTLPTLRAQDQNTSAPSTNSHGGGQKRPHHHFGDLANLTEDERQQLKADMEKIKDDSELVAAHEALKQAEEKLKETLHTLLVNEDPSIQAVLDKMRRGGNGGSNNPTPTSESN